jgi:Spy/CpxP family protein refolding chaperone
MKRNLLTVVALLATCSALLTPSLLWAQPGGPQRGPGGPGGPGGLLGGGGILNLVQREEVQQELQLVDEQRNKLEDFVADARQRFGDELRDMFAQMRDLSEEDRQAQFDKIRARVEKLNKESEGDLKKILLPHQFDRLKQISVQQRVQQQGAAALTTGELAETLNLTDEQREKLERRSAEVQQELQEKIAQLRLEARNKMLEVLTPEQRTKLQSLMGDAFALPEGGFGPGGFQGRGRGGFFGGGNNGPQRQGNRDRDRAQNSNGTN